MEKRCLFIKHNSMMNSLLSREGNYNGKQQIKTVRRWKLEEVNGGADSETDEMMEGPLKVYHIIQNVKQIIKNSFGN